MPFSRATSLRSSIRLWSSRSQGSRAALWNVLVLCKAQSRTALQLRKERPRRAKIFCTHLIGPDQQSHQLPSIVRKMRICSATRNYVTSEIGTFRRAIFNVVYLRLCYGFVGWFNSQGNAGTPEREFPRRSTSFSCCKHPRVQGWQIEVLRLRQRDFVERLFTREEFGNR